MAPDAVPRPLMRLPQVRTFFLPCAALFAAVVLRGQTSGQLTTPSAALAGPMLERGRQVYTLCGACHGPDGKGVPEIAPPIEGSAVVREQPDELLRSILHGRNHNRANTKFPEMPSLGGLEDDDIAAVASYVRARWAGVSGMVSAEEVRLARSANAGTGSGNVNILLITVDNVGFGDFGCYGNTFIQSPHVDRLAREGVRLTDFYTPSPTCTVSRASLLTGRYPLRHGLTRQLIAEPYRGPARDLETLGNLGIGLRHSERLIAGYLKQAGYATGAFGKWNIGFAPGSRPTERGFDEYIGIASGNANHFNYIYAGRNDLFAGTKPINRDGTFSSDLFADSAIDFIRRHRDRRFFVYLPFSAVHYNSAKNLKPGEKLEIWQAPARFLEQYGYRPGGDQRLSYAAMLTATDQAMGRVLAVVDELGLRENTLVLFMSDNGVFMREGVGLGAGSNGPLRSGGATLWEGGIRVPAIVRWPGTIPAGSVCREPLTSMDYFVLALRAAGVPLPEPGIDGRDPLPALQGRGRSPHQALHFDYQDQQAIRKGRYKAIKPGRNSAAWELYDLERDIGESRNIAADEPALAAEMQREFTAWRDGFMSTVKP